MDAEHLFWLYFLLKRYFIIFSRSFVTQLPNYGIYLPDDNNLNLRYMC